LIRGSLLDLNVLIALTDETHQHHRIAKNWLHTSGRKGWGICPLTESGYLRVTTNPAIHSGGRTLKKCLEVLEALAIEPGYCYWPITSTWAELTTPFAARIFGHQQVTDAYLLGLAIKNNGVLVTFDRGLRYMAGAEFQRHLLVLE
jgi:toxin-antitoxin system PIN domain toxin